MNTVSEIKREDIFGLNLGDITQNHRRSGRALDKVYKIDVVLHIKDILHHKRIKFTLYVTRRK